AEEICGVVEEDRPPGVRLRVERCVMALPIDADPLHLRHGVFNLVMNAFESMRESPGEVLVETGARRLDPETMTGLVHGQDEPPGDFAYLRVSDEGGGMDPDTEERAFEPFFSTRHKGRGEGLSTVLGLARTHDGLIALDNQPGRGCTFTLYLPLIDDAELDETVRGH
ncbi:MAG TPA: hypothetical protein ENO23_07990, partial [Alphaproteobacteria bacterium]|nr:hypothetical protein [Alphaproteobacteria bacterium]